MAIGKVEIIDGFDRTSCDNLKIRFACCGEDYSRKIHGSKTEIKAVTFSNMRILQDDQTGAHHIYVIFDI